MVDNGLNNKKYEADDPKDPKEMAQVGLACAFFLAIRRYYSATCSRSWQNYATKREAK